MLYPDHPLDVDRALAPLAPADLPALARVKRGEVVSITAARNEIVMHHEPIAGFMQGMTMPFPVASRDLLEGVEPGDRVEGVLLVEGARYALVSLAEIPKGEPAAAE